VLVDETRLEPLLCTLKDAGGRKRMGSLKYYHKKFFNIASLNHFIALYQLLKLCSYRKSGE
jgi:hypothetical protein